MEQEPAANSDADKAFAEFVVNSHMATAEQIRDARDSQAMIAEHSMHVSLGEVLVRLGTITAAQRENVEKALRREQIVLEKIGNYKVLKRIGQGATGNVFLAEDPAAMRTVAIKVLAPKYATDEEFLARFRREAQAIGKLNHPNIVSAFAMGEDNGLHYYAMEYCDGESLDRVLKREKTIPYDRALEIILQVARGLQHAHMNKIIHRDIKPDNIILGADGSVKILDMGLAKINVKDDESYNTQSGNTVGTPHYMSPEQAQGRPNLDGRSDIYSLGATLYNLVTGRTPFQGSANEVMNAQIKKQIPNPQDLRDDISDSVVQLIKKMMAKAPEDRYRDCNALAADISRVLEGKMPLAPDLDSAKSSVAIRAVSRNSTTKERSDHAPRGLSAKATDTTRKRTRMGIVRSSSMLYLATVFLGSMALGAAYVYVYLKETQKTATPPANVSPKPPLAPAKTN